MILQAVLYALEVDMWDDLCRHLRGMRQACRRTWLALRDHRAGLGWATTLVMITKYDVGLFAAVCCCLLLLQVRRVERKHMGSMSSSLEDD
jgi:hypothetical protein